jgi:hypothetical protein
MTSSASCNQVNYPLIISMMLICATGIAVGIIWNNAISWSIGSTILFIGLFSPFLLSLLYSHMKGVFQNEN